MLKFVVNISLWSCVGFNLEEACRDISNFSLKYIDLFTRRNCDTTTDNKSMNIVERVDMQKMKELLVAKNPPQTIKYLYSLL